MTLDDFKEILKEERPSFYQYPQPVRVYLHWTAGHYYTSFPEYHICIDADGGIIESLPLTEIPQATWHRNTGSIAIALCCCAGATAYKGDPYEVDLGEEPPTDAQIETLAQVMAAISDVFDIPIDIEHFMTHAEAADNLDGYNAHDPYGPNSTCERWDLAMLHEDDEWMSGGDTLRGKAIFYRSQMDMLDEE